MGVRTARLAAVIVVLALQISQLGVAFTARAASCCCRGTTCPMKMRCAGRSCTMTERPAAVSAVRGVVPSAVAIGELPAAASYDVAMTAPVLEGFVRVGKQPPREV